MSNTEVVIISFPFDDKQNNTHYVNALVSEKIKLWSGNTVSSGIAMELSEFLEKSVIKRLSHKRNYMR